MERIWDDVSESRVVMFKVVPTRNDTCNNCIPQNIERISSAGGSVKDLRKSELLNVWERGGGGDVLAQTATEHGGTLKVTCRLSRCKSKIRSNSVPKWCMQPYETTCGWGFSEDLRKGELMNEGVRRGKSKTPLALLPTTFRGGGGEPFVGAPSRISERVSS